MRRFNLIRKLCGIVLVIISVDAVGQATIGCDETLQPTSEYDDIDCMQNGLMAAFKNNKVGIIDSTGNVIVPVQYDSLYSVNENIIH